MTGIGAGRSDGNVVCVEAVWFHGDAVEVAELEQGTGRHRAKEILLRRRTSTVEEIDNCKFKFRTRFIMTRIKPSMHDSNILDSTYIINMISENMIMN